MSYFGKRYEKGPSFDPGNIVQINNTVTLTDASANKTLMLNSPANYVLNLPQLSSMTIGDTITFNHSHTSGTVTLAAFAGDTIELLGIGNTEISVNVGNIITIQKTDTTSVWSVVSITDSRTAPQGTNNTTTASTAFVINEFGKHKNYLINGNFSFWQRATTLAAGTGARFCADRWFNSSTGSTIEVSRQTLTLGQLDSVYYHRSIVSSVANTSNSALLSQRIEGVRTLSGKKATLSFYAKADAAKTIGIEFVQNFGTGGSPSPIIDSIGVTLQPLTTTFSKYSITVDIPNVSGKTLGTDGNDFLSVNFWFDAGSSFNGRSGGIGQQSGTFDIAQVQLEEGSVATQFEYRHPAVEEFLCKRYYELIKGSFSFNGYGAAGAVYNSSIWYQEKRSLPVCTISASWATSNCSAPIVSPYVSTKCASIRVTITALGGFHINTSDGTPALYVDAEL